MIQRIIPKIPYTLWRREMWCKRNPFLIDYQMDVPYYNQPTWHVHKLCGVYFGRFGIHEHSVRLGCRFYGNLIELLEYTYIGGERHESTLGHHEIKNPLHISFKVEEDRVYMYYPGGMLEYWFGLNKGNARPANPYVEPAPNRVLKFKKNYIIKKL